MVLGVPISKQIAVKRWKAPNKISMDSKQYKSCSWKKSNEYAEFNISILTLNKNLYIVMLIQDIK